MAREETSVLDRELFRPKSRGIEELPESEDNGDLKARQEQAFAMIEAAKQKFDPANFQTLAEQSRPGVFRPVAVNMPAQQQTATTAQRMQQMSQMGMRPIGMADGGPVYRFAEGGMKPTINSSGYTEDLTSDEQDILAKEKAAEREFAARKNLNTFLRAGDITDLISTNSFGYPEDLTSDERRTLAKEKAAEREFAARKRLRALLGTEQPVDLISSNEAPVGQSTSTLTDEEIDKSLEGVNPETGLKAPSGDVYPNEPSNIPVPLDKEGAPVQPSRQTLRPPISSWDTFNPGKAVDEWTEKKIEEQAAAAPLPKVIPGGQFVRPEYPRTLTREELAVKKAREEGIPVATPDASAGPAATAETPAATPEGVAALVGSGRGAVEKPGERKAYAEAVIARNRASGGSPASTAGGAGTATATGTDAAHPTNLSDIKRDRDDAFNMALMQAGLAMMAGKSSNALANIGEGGIAGLQAYANQLAQSRARALEERKLGMMEKYYGSREKALDAANVRHMDAIRRIQLDAMKAADAAVATELKANPTMAKRDADLLRQQTYDRYMSVIGNNAELTSSAPELNPEATSILGD